MESRRSNCVSPAFRKRLANSSIKIGFHCHGAFCVPPFMCHCPIFARSSAVVVYLSENRFNVLSQHPADRLEDGQERGGEGGSLSLREICLKTILRKLPL